MSQELTALQTAYTDLQEFCTGLDEPTSWRPTGCPGWAVRDLVFHLLGDAQRALVALAGPYPSAAPDRDAVSYWTDSPGREDPDSRGLRATRTQASAWRLSALVATYVETSRAVVALAERVPGSAVVVTQGHVLRAGDLLVTLAVEAAVHHLDLIVDCDLPGPSPEPLALVRRTLDGLLGRPAPVQWDDLSWARLGTGRRPPSPAERALLGPDAARLPLLA